jgi:hypothetical protein
MTDAVKNTQVASVWGPIYDITVKKGQTVLDAAAKAGHEVVRVYGYNTTPDHNNKQCIDFMITDGKKAPDTRIADWLVKYLIKNAKVLGVEGIIYNRRVMGFPSNGTMYRGPEGSWRPYSGPSPHTDHVHVQFNTNAIKGKVAAAVKPKKKPWTGDLYVIKDVAWYDGKGNRRGVIKAGTKVHGHVASKKFNDGRYFCIGKIPHRQWMPLDSGNFSHKPNGKPIKGK